MPASFVVAGVRDAVPIACHGGVVPVPPHVDAPPRRSTGRADEPTERVSLIRLAWARSGDKGDISNVGVVARRPEWLPLLWRELTTERVAAYLAHLVRGRVERFHLPGIAAINFVLHEALDGGGASSHRLDPLGKGMAQILLDMPIDVPLSIIAD